MDGKSGILRDAPLVTRVAVTVVGKYVVLVFALVTFMFFLLPRVLIWVLIVVRHGD